MQLSDANDFTIEPEPVDGSVSHLVKCKSGVSPKCHKWHLNKKKCCNACNNYVAPKPLVPRVVDPNLLYKKSALCSFPNGKAVRQPGELTPRQLEVFTLYCEGKSIKEIGPLLSQCSKIPSEKKMGVSAKTVEYHMAKIKESLGIFNPVHLIHFAFHNGLVKNHYTPTVSSAEMTIN